MKSLHSKLIGCASIVALTTVGISSPSIAQSNNTSVQDEIVVVGSRIARKDYSSSSPVVTVSEEALGQFGAVTVDETLKTLPQFAEGQGAGTVAIGGGGGATLNMRALGTNRNLVLLDQRRLPVTTPFGDVDVNILPTIVLKNVEILTGGASSIYGSEAISGVANFQTADFGDKVQVNVEYGDAFEGGASTQDYSLLSGTTGERGRTIFSFGYTDREALRGADRDFFSFAIPSSFIGQGNFRSGGNAPTQDAVDTLFASYGITDETISTDRLGFNDDGTLFTQFGGALNYKGPDGDDTLFWVRDGTEVRQPVGRQGTALKGLVRYTGFMKGEYDFTENMTGYAQLLYSDSVTKGSASRNLTLFGPTALVPYNHPDLAATDLPGLLATRADPTAPFILNQRFLGVPERTHEESFQTSQFVVGMKGDLGSTGWNYDIYAMRDDVKAREEIQSLVLGSRLNELLNSTDAEGNLDGGDSICDGGYNPFGLANSTSISDACGAYLAPDVTSTLDLDRTAFEAIVSGSVFELPAGDVQLSASAGYREDNLKFNPSISVQTGDAMGVGLSLPSKGQTKTTEFGVEALVPVTDNLNLTAGARSSNQNVTGSEISWNMGLEFAATESIFLRGSLQKALRAPNIGELFSAAIGNEITVGDPSNNAANGDPCDIRTSFRTGSNASGVEAVCLAQGLPAAQLATFQHTTTSLPTSTGGNTDLDAESATTFTLGAVWRPTIDKHDLTVTIDYWNIEIDDVINPINGNDVLDRCFNTSFNATLDPNNEFCQLVTRESATGTVSEIATTFLNLAGLKTNGVDVQVAHSVEIGEGTLKTNASIGWLNTYEEQALPGEDFIDFTGTIGGPANRRVDNDIHPELQVNVAPSYEFGNVSIGARWRHIAGMDAKDTVTNPSSTTPSVSAFDYFDLFGSYQIREDLRLKASLNNVFDKAPPEVAGQIGQTRLGTYDVIGTTLRVGIQTTF